MGEQGRSARRLETHRRSGPGHQETGAYHFSHECGYLSQWQRGRHRCTREERRCQRRTHRYECKGHERMKFGSHKICIREDLAKEKMVFSQESSQAIFEMGDVELIELKTSVFQCPSCVHNVFKGTLLCRCGKHIRPDLGMMRRIKAALEVLQAPCFRTSSINARGYEFMARTPPQSKRRTTWLFENQKTVCVDLGPLANWRELQGVSPCH